MAARTPDFRGSCASGHPFEGALSGAAGPIVGPRSRAHPGAPWWRHTPPVPRKGGNQRVAAGSFDAVLVRRPGPWRTGRSRRPAPPVPSVIAGPGRSSSGSSSLPSTGPPSPNPISCPTTPRTGNLPATFSTAIRGPTSGRRSTSQWFRNLAVDPDPAVWLGGRVRPANASVHRGPVSLAVLELA